MCRPWLSLLAPALCVTGRLLKTSSCRPVQVLDDSTCKATRVLVDDKVLEWKERGVNVECIRRTNRQGYKAGALKEVGADSVCGLVCWSSLPYQGSR